MFTKPLLIVAGVSDVSPSLAIEDAADGALTYSKAESDNPLTAFRRANSQNVSVSQFGLPVPCSARRDVPTLPHHVAHIGRVISQEEMIDIYAGRAIASVADENSLRDGSVGERPHQPMNTPRHRPNLHSPIPGPPTLGADPDDAVASNHSPGVKFQAITDRCALARAPSRIWGHGANITQEGRI